MDKNNESGMEEVFGRQDFDSWEDAWGKYILEMQGHGTGEEGKQEELPYSRGIPYEYVMEGSAHDPERERVHGLRMEGMGCGEISEITGIPEDQVREYLRKLGLPEEGAAIRIQPLPGQGESAALCPVCGARLQQPYKGRHRRFCSDACRYVFWNQKHRDEPKDGRAAVCMTCGREFQAVNEKVHQRRYCCWPCYFRARYGRWPAQRVR